MKTFLIALLGLVALAISVRVAEEESAHIAGRGAKAPGHPVTLKSLMTTRPARGRLFKRVTVRD